MTAASFFGVRETLLPGPSQTTGYRTVLIIGPTGAGKTTLVQQLVGSDPETERFLSTSASKTTIAETELLCAPGDYYGVVTFSTRAETRTAVAECVEAAAIALLDERPTREVRRRLLSHRDLRFRLQYIISEGVTVDDEMDDGRRRRPPPASPEISQIRSATEELIEWVLDVLARVLDQELERQPIGDEDTEERLKQRLADHPYVTDIVERLMTEIELRFDPLSADSLTRGGDGWPLYWRGEARDRQAFVADIGRFTSNAAEDFGTLLTPLVNGIRVRGPLHPIWAPEIPYVMLVDGEGLGHTPDSTMSLPTATTRMFDMVDTILLVDNGQQPMQATASAALRQVAAAGHTEKLALVFTHFDQVRGPNLVTFSDRTAHVMASVDQIVRVYGEEYGFDAGRALARHVHDNAYFVGGLHVTIDPAESPRTIEQLQSLYGRLRVEAEPLDLGLSRPVYSVTRLDEAIDAGVQAFRSDWETRLGLGANPAPSPLHWATLKALTRRYAERVSDEHDSLRPVGDLHAEIVDRVRRVIETPESWDGDEPEAETQLQIIGLLARGMSGRIRLAVSRQLLDRAGPLWQHACAIEGEDAAARRADYIASSIFGSHLTEVESLGRPFPAELLDELCDAARDLDVELQATA